MIFFVGLGVGIIGVLFGEVDAHVLYDHAVDCDGTLGESGEFTRTVIPIKCKDFKLKGCENLNSFLCVFPYLLMFCGVTRTLEGPPNRTQG